MHGEEGGVTTKNTKHRVMYFTRDIQDIMYARVAHQLIQVGVEDDYITTVRSTT